jgi:hypothetical protein
LRHVRCTDVIVLLIYNKDGIKEGIDEAKKNGISFMVIYP